MSDIVQIAFVGALAAAFGALLTYLGTRSRQPRIDRRTDLDYEAATLDYLRDAGQSLMAASRSNEGMAAALQTSLNAQADLARKVDNMPKVIADLRAKGVIDAAVEVALRDALLGLGMARIDQPPTGTPFPMAQTEPPDLLKRLADEKALHVGDSVILEAPPDTTASK